MAAAVEEHEEASDEMVAALAAGGTFSFEPEPDEDELLPVEAVGDTEEPDVDEAVPTPHARPATARPAAARRPAPAKKDDEESAD